MKVKASLFISLFFFCVSPLIAQNVDSLQMNIIKGYYSLYGSDSGLKLSNVSENFTYTKSVYGMTSKDFDWEYLISEMEEFNQTASKLVNYKLIENRGNEWLYEIQMELVFGERKVESHGMDHFVFGENNQLIELHSSIGDYDFGEVFEPIYEDLSTGERASIDNYYSILEQQDYEQLKSCFSPDFVHISRVDGFSNSQNLDGLLRSFQLRFEDTGVDYKVRGKYLDVIYVDVTTSMSTKLFDFEVFTQERFSLKDEKIVKMTTILLDPE